AVYAVINREFHFPKLWDSGNQPAESRYRPGLDPEARLRRDFWFRPLPLVGIFLLIEAGIVVIDQIITFPDFGFYICSSLVFGFMLSFVVLRPMGVHFFETALGGRTGSPRSGDWGRAWMVLPVRRESMTRAIYLHSLIAATLLWIGILGVNCLDTCLETGLFALRDTDGDSAFPYLFPYVALVPCVAGAVTCVAVGDMFRAFIAIAAAVAFFIGHIALLILKTPTAVHAGVLIALALVGGGPALRYLRRSKGVPAGDKEASRIAGSSVTSQKGSIES
ncbi:MAG: hypothetical protein KJ645_11285, partial [Planctomycetes bacterium]|nr:hypothetical protein [Planctomycetota bacterium]